MTKTVLTIDDSRTMRDMLLMALEDAAHHTGFQLRKRPSSHCTVRISP